MRKLDARTWQARWLTGDILRRLRTRAGGSVGGTARALKIDDGRKHHVIALEGGRKLIPDKVISGYAKRFEVDEAALRAMIELVVEVGCRGSEPTEEEYEAMLDEIGARHIWFL